MSPSKELANWCDLVAYQVKAYQQVAASLFPSVREEYFDRRPARRQKADEHETAIRRLCLEDARYLLPQSVKANLYHTVSALTLLRYLRLAKRYEFADETTELCRQMLDCVLEVDPLFDKDVERVEDSEDPWALDEEGDLPWEIDSARMAIKNAYSMLLDVSGAIDLDDPLLVGAIDPAENSILLDNLGLQAMDRRTQITEFVHFTFLKALSLTADAQSQRHRAIRRYQTALPDVFPSPERIRTPVKVARCETTRRLYEDHVSEITLRGRSLHSVDPAPIHYTLPNGFVTHFIETGSLAGFAHRWKMRLCLLAQDEIRQAAEEEVRDVMGLGELQGIGAPCHIRHRGGVRPPCPEGDRFCGVRVWETPVGGPAT